MWSAHYALAQGHRLWSPQMEECGTNAAYASTLGAHRLDILVDCLDYGSFFKPNVHQTVHDIVCEVAKTIEVRILVCGEVPQPLTEPSGRSLSKDELDTYCAALREDKGFSRFLEELAFPENVTFKTFETTWFKTPPPSGSLDACRRVCSPGSAVSPPVQRIDGYSKRYSRSDSSGLPDSYDTPVS